MRTRKRCRVAIVSVVVVALIGTLAWLGRGHIRFALALKSLGRNAQGYDDLPRGRRGEEGCLQYRGLVALRVTTIYRRCSRRE